MTVRPAWYLDASAFRHFDKLSDRELSDRKLNDPLIDGLCIAL